MNLLHETILITVSLHEGGIGHETLTLLTKHHGFDEVEILDAVELLIKRRRLGVNKELKLICLENAPEEIPAGYLAAAEKYKEAKKATFWDWFCGIFDCIKFALALFIITTFFAIGVCVGN